MTSDLVQNRALKDTDAKVVNSSRDFFSFLKKSTTQTVHTQPLPANANDLLKSAYRMLEQAEKELSDKNARIASLERILTVDELTSLTNRRGFFEIFKRELERTNRGENKGGLLIMIDLDYFKNINDTHGHLAGDEALKTVGRFLETTMRNTDVAARIGGDEFIILMPNTCIAKAMARAQSIGDDLNRLTFNWKGDTVHINGSLGLKEYKRGDTINGIIDSADKGLYESKSENRQPEKERAHTTH